MPMNVEVILNHGILITKTTFCLQQPSSLLPS